MKLLKSKLTIVFISVFFLLAFGLNLSAQTAKFNCSSTQLASLSTIPASAVGGLLDQGAFRCIGQDVCMKNCQGAELQACLDDRKACEWFAKPTGFACGVALAGVIFAVTKNPGATAAGGQAGYHFCANSAYQGCKSRFDACKSRVWGMCCPRCPSGPQTQDPDETPDAS